MNTLYQLVPLLTVFYRLSSLNSQVTHSLKVLTSE